MFTHCKNQPNSILHLLVLSILILMTFSTTVSLARVERTTDGGDRIDDASVEIPGGGSGDPGDGLTGDPGDGDDKNYSCDIQSVFCDFVGGALVVIHINEKSIGIIRIDP